MSKLKPRRYVLDRDQLIESKAPEMLELLEASPLLHSHPSEADFYKAEVEWIKQVQLIIKEMGGE